MNRTTLHILAVGLSAALTAQTTRQHKAPKPQSAGQLYELKIGGIGG